jgi:S-adenosylmethionine:tRNA ribosyltransferase-isomerase
MVLSRESGRIANRKFSDLPRLLRRGDLLVLNDARVFRARVTGRKTLGGAKVEIFFLEPDNDPMVWRAMVRPGRKLPPGAKVETAGGHIITVESKRADGSRNVRVSGVPPADLFEADGVIPLPPYIKNSIAPEEMYQTIYSDRTKNRSVASPTAGLHFTRELLEKLERMGVTREFITLDVGIGTFRPVRTSDIRDHRMHSERCSIEKSAADRINEAKSAGHRIVAVGTTAVRALESFADESGHLAYGERDTDIFIRPGYRFRITDALITNFHLPRSTLLMLVAAFAGYNLTMRAYEAATAGNYRFFSFGDAMLIE